MTELDDMLDRTLARHRAMYVRAHKANEERIKLLIADAEAAFNQHDAAGRHHQASHAAGVRDGLRRALDVLEGRG